MQSTGWHNFFEGTQFVSQLGYCVRWTKNFLWFSSVPPGKWLRRYVRQNVVTPFHALSNSLLTLALRLDCVWPEALTAKGNVKTSISAPRRRIVGAKIYLHLLLTSPLDRGDWSSSRHDRLTSEKNPDSHWLGDWVSLRAGLDDFEKIKISCPYRDSNPESSSP
jgi:hypothetical protein